MEAKQVKDLMEAYASVYNQPEEQEVLSEDLQSAVEKGLDAAAKNPVVKAIGKVIAPVGKGRGTVTKAEQESKIRSNKQEDLDVFDLVKGHLLDEGFAETEEAALVIMANMSEDWKQSIVEQLNPDLPGGTYSDFQKNHELQKKLSGMSSADRKKYIDNLPRVGPDGKRLKGV